MQIENSPFKLFEEWLSLAEKSEPNDPTAMSYATVDQNGLPNIRMLLMRRYDERGIVFFTNFESQKGEELLANKQAAACFHWKTLRKQIRFRGLVEVVTEEEADDYFTSRPRGSQIASTASKQSRSLKDRSIFEADMKALEEKYEGKEVPRPEHWSGFRLQPLSIEFWDDGEFRTHDRLRYDRKSLEEDWTTVWLYP